MALLCTQHTHANPHTQTHTHTDSHTPVTDTYKVWNDDDYGGGCCCCYCVCVLYVYLIYIYYIYFLIGLNFFRELTQRFLHAIFWFLFYFYFFALRRAQRVCHRTRASTETEIEQPKEHHGARIRIYFCWMSGWMKRRAYCAFVCVCLCVPTRFF